MAATVTNPAAATRPHGRLPSRAAAAAARTAVAKLGGFVSIHHRDRGGSGYTTEPTVTIRRRRLQRRHRDVNVNDSGDVTSITITSAGSGCTSAPAVSFGGPGSGAAATATVLGTPGKVAQVVFTSLGSGYTSAPAASFTGGGGGSGAVATPSICNYAPGNGILTCTVGTLDAGSVTTATIDGIARASPRQMINTASAAYNETDSNTATTTPARWSRSWRRRS